MNIDGLKNTVIKRSTSGNVKIANLLRKAITAYERSRITRDWLLAYFRVLRGLEK